MRFRINCRTFLAKFFARMKIKPIITFTITVA